jgi:hypothetical protein
MTQNINIMTSDPSLEGWAPCSGVVVVLRLNPAATSVRTSCDVVPSGFRHVLSVVTMLDLAMTLTAWSPTSVVIHRPPIAADDLRMAKKGAEKLLVPATLDAHTGEMALVLMRKGRDATA